MGPGSGRTFDEFVREELAGLARFAGALTGDHHLAEDVLSDALLAASLRWRRITVMEHPAAYVRRIVVSTFLSERRKTRRRRTYPTNDQTLIDQAQAPDRSIDEHDRLRQLLAGLTPAQRAAIVLRYLHDQTDDEIADTLHCSTATVRSHLSHAREALRQAATPERDQT